MDFFQLEQFKAIAQSRTMREAADRLYLSQPSLSRNLKNLESELGCQLFYRSHGRLEITSCGEILLRHVDDILDSVNSVISEINVEKMRGAECVRVGCFSLPLGYQALPQMATSFKDRQFRCRICDKASLLAEFKSGELDIVILDEDVSDDETICKPVFTEQATLSIPLSSELASREEVELDELGGEGLYLIEQQHGYSDWFEELAERSGATAATIRRAPQEEYLTSCDEMDSCYFSSDYLESYGTSVPDRVRIPIRGVGTQRVIYVAYKKRKGSKVADLASYLCENIKLRFGGMSYLPFFLYPDSLPNLEIEID